MTVRLNLIEDRIARALLIVATGTVGAGIFSLSAPLGAAFGSELLSHGRVPGMVTLFIEAVAFTASLVAVSWALDGKAAHLMRTMNVSGAGTFAYLARHVQQFNVAIGLFYAGVTVGCLGALTNSQRFEPLTWLAVPAAGGLACALTLWTAWSVAILCGRYAGVLAVSLQVWLGTSLLAVAFSPRYLQKAEDCGLIAGLLSMIPAHWPVAAAQSVIAGNFEAALALGTATLVAAVGLRALIVNRLGEPLRAPMLHGAERPALARKRDAYQQPDRARRWTPALSAPLWIAMRSAGLHGDLIAPRLFGFLVGWFLVVLPLGATWLIFYHHGSRSEVCDGVTLWFVAGVALSLFTALRGHQAVAAQEDPMRVNRGGRMYPAWAMLPLGPWRTTFRRALFFVALAWRTG